MKYCKTKKNKQKNKQKKLVKIKISNQKETVNVRDNILVHIPDGENVK